MEFKMRQQQHQRKITPQYQEYPQSNGEHVTDGVDWEEFEIQNIVNREERTLVMQAQTAMITRHENGYKDDHEKKKKKKYVWK